MKILWGVPSIFGEIEEEGTCCREHAGRLAAWMRLRSDSTVFIRVTWCARPVSISDELRAGPVHRGLEIPTDSNDQRLCMRSGMRGGSVPRKFDLGSCISVASRPPPEHILLTQFAKGPRIARTGTLHVTITNLINRQSLPNICHKFSN